MMDMEQRLHKAVGMADLSELLTAAFSNPTPEVAKALADGTFASDWEDAFADAAGNWRDGRAPHAENPYAQADYAELHREFSRLYFYPGNKVPIWPYENCFKFRARGRTGLPGLFRSPGLMDVERQMREAGVIPPDVRTEPADTMFREFGFLAYLYGKSAETLEQSLSKGETLDGPDEWHTRARTFAHDHALTWLPAFMDQTIELTRSDVYKELARAAQGYLDLLSADTEGYAE